MSFNPVWYFLRIILAEILGFFLVIRPQPYWRSYYSRLVDTELSSSVQDF